MQESPYLSFPMDMYCLGHSSEPPGSTWSDSQDLSGSPAPANEPAMADPASEASGGMPPGDLGAGEE